MAGKFREEDGQRREKDKVWELICGPHIKQLYSKLIEQVFYNMCCILHGHHREHLTMTTAGTLSAKRKNECSATWHPRLPTNEDMTLNLACLMID
jgi:hypothetical protein